MIRDPFGLTRLVYAGDHHAASARALFAACPDLPHSLDVDAIGAHLDGAPRTDRTCFAAIRAVPPGHALVATSGAGFVVRPHPPVPRAGDLLALLRAAMGRALRETPGPHVVALSGGLDSAIVLALARETDPGVRALVLSPQLPGYSEVDAALATARQLGVDADVVEVTADDLRAALPDAIAAFEEPLYNLHPVAKCLLARAAAAGGHATVLSGDGADQVFTRDVSADYLPLVGAAFTTAGVTLRTPFLDDDVIAHIVSLAPDADKRALRDVGAQLGVPAELVQGRKVSRLAPPIDLADVEPPGRLAALAALLGRSLPTFDDDRTRVQWTTLALLVDAFEAWA